MDPHFMTLGEFEVAESRMARIFRQSVHLPDRVFREGYFNFEFVTFDEMMTTKFWDVLLHHARTYRDHSISVMVLDPDPRKFLQRASNQVGSLLFSPEASPKDYIDALSFQPSEEFPLSIVADEVTWFGDSLQWAYWGNRAHELGVFGSVTRANHNVPGSPIRRYGRLDPWRSLFTELRDREQLEFLQTLGRNYEIPD